MTKGNKKLRLGSVEVHRLLIPLHKLKNISDDDRYSYYLLSHMFNELMCLQKLIHFAMPKHGDRRTVRFHPEMAQAQFLFRIALGKVSEVRDELEKNKKLEATFIRLIQPRWPEEQQCRAILLAALDSAPWLKKLRNRLGFHFPNFVQLLPFITPNDEWKDDEIFVSNLSGNTFYDAANDVVLHLMFSLYSSDPQAEGSIKPVGTERLLESMDSMIRQMIDLITQVNNYLEKAVGALVESVLQHIPAMPPGEAIIAPHFLDVQIPFWTHMPRRSESD